MPHGVLQASPTKLGHLSLNVQLQAEHGFAAQPAANAWLAMRGR
jgi:hypothetical protein